MTPNYALELSGPRAYSMKPATEAYGDVIVRGEYHASLETIGWDILKIESDGRFDDAAQAHAAGYFEGYLTAARVLPHARNIPHFQPMTKETKASLKASMDWLDSNLAQLAGQDPYWQQVSLLWDYFNGMHAGITDAGQSFTRTQLFELAALADIQSIEDAIAAEKAAEPHWKTLSPEAFEMHFHRTTHCSALFKLTPDMQDIYFGHCTWIFWPWMARVFKHITLNYNAPEVQAKTVTMSSWAGAMSSMDDYYQTSAGLTVLETSISVFRNEIWVDAQVGQHPDRLLYWMRAMVANRMASDADGWTEVFSRNNGGTYNNEWYILDRKRFTPGQTPTPGLLTVVNQLPTMIRAQDMSAQLARGYVPSFNIPAIAEVFDAAGYPEAIAKNGPYGLSYEDCIRAQIFRRDHGKVQDIAAMQHMMQYNEYQTDPISRSNPAYPEGNPMYAIASRGDKLAQGAQAFGAIDAKISNIGLAGRGAVMAFSGPTPQQGPFSFDAPDVDIGPHEGVPTNPDFSWQEMAP